MCTPKWLRVLRTSRSRSGRRGNNPTHRNPRNAIRFMSISWLRPDVAPSFPALAPCFTRVGIRRTPLPKRCPKIAAPRLPSTPRAIGPPSDLPRPLDKAPRNRASHDGQARRCRYGAVTPRHNTAQSVLYRLPIIIVGELASARGRYGGFGSQICLLAVRREECVGNKM